MILIIVKLSYDEMRRLMTMTSSIDDEMIIDLNIFKINFLDLTRNTVIRRI